MGRARKEITLNQCVEESGQYFVRVRHPVRKKTVCFSLGGAGQVVSSLAALNAVFLDKDKWHDPPRDALPARMQAQWLGPDNALKTAGIAVPAAISDRVESAGRPQDVVVQNQDTLTLQLEVARLRRESDGRLHKCEQQGRELEALRGKKYRKGTFPALQEAKAAFMASYTGRDPSHTENVSWDLERFVQKFGKHTKVDDLEGREGEINAWLRSLTKANGVPIGPSRRMVIRVYVLKLLKENGARLDASRIERPTKKEIKAKRGAIRYLTSAQAEKVKAALPEYYADAFRVQVRIGLRPDELLTLQRSNFKEDFSELTLEPLGTLTLKTGSRRVPIPADLRPLLQSRARACAVLFPEPKGKTVTKARPRKVVRQKRPWPQAAGGLAWRDPKMFNRRFKKALEAAAAAAGLALRMDSRIGRRTCASLLLQANVSAEKIAALLGNSPEQILDAYGDPDVKNMALDATRI